MSVLKVRKNSKKSSANASDSQNESAPKIDKRKKNHSRSEGKNAAGEAASNSENGIDFFDQVPTVQKETSILPFLLIMASTFGVTYGLSQIVKINIDMSELKTSFSKLMGPKEKVDPAGYFQIRVVGEDSVPVEGAKVYIGGKAVGRTDLAGEWAKFARVKRGSTYTVVVKVSEGPGKKVRSLVKNFAIPFDVQSDAEFKHEFVLGSETRAQGRPGPETSENFPDPKVKHDKELGAVSGAP